jgi:hypothetical protein
MTSDCFSKGQDSGTKFDKLYFSFKLSAFSFQLSAINSSSNLSALNLSFVFLSSTNASLNPQT